MLLLAPQLGQDGITTRHAHVAGRPLVAQDDARQQTQRQRVIAVGPARGLDLGPRALDPLRLEEGQRVLGVERVQVLVTTASQALQLAREETAG